MTLRDWLTKHNISVAELARRIGVSSETVYRYRDGTRRPSWRVMPKIIAATKGQVTADSFLTPRQVA